MVEHHVSDNQSAIRAEDYAAALELLESVTRIDTEEEVSAGIVRMFTKLFDAERVAYAIVERGVPRPIVQSPGPEGESELVEMLAYLDGATEIALPTASDTGFIAGIQREGELMGIIRVGRVATAPLSRCIELARAISGVCGLAVDNARAYARIAVMDAERVRAVKLESLGLFAGGMAHDFNNLLTIVVGHADLVSRRPDDPEEVRLAAEAILGSARRAAGIVERLVAAAAVQMLHVEEADLNSIVSQSVGAFQSILGAEIELHLDLSSSPVPVSVDTEQMKTVLVNLATNARDAMAQGGIFTVRTAVTVNRAVLSCTDTGSGMDEETRKRIFEPYFTTREFGMSAGWGLAVCNGIIMQHGGVIRVASAPGEGSTFTISLPLPASD
jgi:signal transduction histidine kinase